MVRTLTIIAVLLGSVAGSGAARAGIAPTTPLLASYRGPLFGPLTLLLSDPPLIGDAQQTSTGVPFSSIAAISSIQLTGGASSGPITNGLTVPEPAALALLGSGLVALARVRRRR